MARQRLTPERILMAYRRGAFPMASPWSDEIDWYSPDPRGILPLDRFHVPRSLRRSMRRFRLTTDRAFAAVVEGCADRPSTWISSEVRAAYEALHAMGHAHSVESWSGGDLVGGVYGVALGGAFMAESMFHRRTDAGKASLVGLVWHLVRRRFVLCDIQMVTPATRRFGAVEIPRAEYLRRLERAMKWKPAWGSAEDFENSQRPERPKEAGTSGPPRRP